VRYNMDRQKGVLLKSALDLPTFINGKVRDTYELGEHLLIVATDRISAFDVVLPAGIPNKGKVLNQLSAFWFEKTAHIVPNHVVEPVTKKSNLEYYLLKGSKVQFPGYLAGRSMVVKKAVRLSVECVVRGYLAGSGWSEYKRQGTVCGIKLPDELVESQELPEPIFTPTTKAEAGHDMPMTMAEVGKMLGAGLAEKIKTISLAIYSYARDYAKSRGFIIADTKMEFGLDGSDLILIDELLTPDSSRFWDIERYEMGRPQDSFDKQPLRDWLENSGWNKEPPAPMLPANVLTSTAKRYETAFERLTGKKLI
jgi:phosphoribosylaminoimidazole-succinocarboxamide synthase